jgi:Domain of unknown function (DUF4956)
MQRPETSMLGIINRHNRSSEDGTKGQQPRLLWLLGFQTLVIALVVLMARATRGLTSPPLLEERLGPLSEHAVAAPIQEAFGGGRGWLAALVAMLGALLLMLPVVWAYIATKWERKVDRSVVTTITLLPIAVAAILVIVQDSLAVAFSLAGIAGVVRFRNALEDTTDAMYVFGAIAVGLGAGVGALEASAALTALFNVVAVALWKWNTSPPEIADIALGSERQDDPLVPRIAEWLKPTETMKLDVSGAKPANGASKREGMLRVRAADDVSTRANIESVLQQFAKRWTLESDDGALDGAPTLTYQVRLNKRVDPEELLTALHRQLGPEDSRHRAPAGSSSSTQE